MPTRTRRNLPATPPTDVEPAPGPKRAVIYIRVSTKQQAVRDGNPEGYSLPTQRNGCRRKIEEDLRAVVADEYVDKDTGTSVEKRPAMQALLERIKHDRDIDYVVVYKLDRWARSQREDLISDFVLETAGCQLVSCSEPIDRTASGRMVHGILASVNEYHSRNMSDEIRRKILIKIQEGGTHGSARLGYKNVGEGSRRWVAVDPEPADLIRWCYAAYATGEWSVSRLLVEATERGLLSRGGPNTPRKPINIAQMHRILSNPYYKGTVVFNGIEYQGKHEPLVDPETWERVQDVLASKANGEKQREHHHYLKGTVYCGHCGSRLIVTYARSKTGVRHPYYVCLGRQQKRTTCMLRARPIALVEDQLAEHYRTVSLSAEGLEATAKVILHELERWRQQSERDRTRHERRLAQIEAEQLKLLQAHYADAIPLDLLRKEQTRLTDELEAVQRALAQANASRVECEATADAAVDWAKQCHRAYLELDERQRRMMNRAFFRRVWVTEQGVVGWEYSQPFATLMRAHGATERVLLVEYESNAQTIADDQFEAENARPVNRRSPGRWARAYFRQSLKEFTLAERVGFEPTVSFPTHDFQSHLARPWPSAGDRKPLCRKGSCPWPSGHVRRGWLPCWLPNASWLRPTGSSRSNAHECPPEHLEACGQTRTRRRSHYEGELAGCRRTPAARSGWSGAMSGWRRTPADDSVRGMDAGRAPQRRRVARRARQAPVRNMMQS